MKVDFNFKDFTEPNLSDSQWYDYLCEYYDVSPDEALELGTRSDGRKPNLPGSRTCEPISGQKICICVNMVVELLHFLQLYYKMLHWKLFTIYLFLIQRIVSI
mgnify:CR=1 FL=1